MYTSTGLYALDCVPNDCGVHALATDKKRVSDGISNIVRKLNNRNGRKGSKEQEEVTWKRSATSQGGSVVYEQMKDSAYGLFSINKFRRYGLCVAIYNECSGAVVPLCRQCIPEHRESLIKGGIGRMLSDLNSPLHSP